MNIVTAILNALTGGLLQRFFDWRIASDRAEYEALNNSEKLAFDERQSIRSTAKEIRLATASFWEMRLITFLIAACFVSHLILVTLDTNFAFGWRIAKFPSPFDEWEGLILLSFFGVQVIGTGVRTVAATAIVKARSRLTWGGKLG